MSTSIKPCGHHLVVEPVKLPEKSAGGIIINVQESQSKLEKAARMIGTVIAIGPQCWKAHAANLADTAEGDALADWAKVGDTVFYSRHSGKYMFDPMDEEDRELYLLHDEDILAVFPPQSEWKKDLTRLSI